MELTEKLRDILGDIQGANLTARKAVTIIERDGYKISGFTLVNTETGDRAIVEMSAVRWISNKESWWLMHESKSPINEMIGQLTNEQIHKLQWALDLLERIQPGNAVHHATFISTLINSILNPKKENNESDGIEAAG
jgi:hypothetical protein